MSYYIMSKHIVPFLKPPNCATRRHARVGVRKDTAVSNRQRKFTVGGLNCVRMKRGYIWHSANVTAIATTPKVTLKKKMCAGKSGHMILPDHI